MWTDRIPLAFPAEHIEAANALAYVIDPDVGGDRTFTLDNQRSGHVYAEIPFVTDPPYAEIVGGRDFATWRAVIDQLSEARNRPNIDDETLELLRSTMLFGAEECASLSEEVGGSA